MNISRNFWVVIVCAVIGFGSASAQCVEPVMDAGLFCSPDAPNDGAPIICSLECLDGFAATMPADLLDNQPETLCAGNGTPNNLSWFAFVAGGTTVDLTITPSNCTEQVDASGNPIFNTIGIQAGIYSSCDFEDEDLVVCFNDCGTNRDNPVNIASNDFVPGQTYYLFVDGCGGSVCDYVVTVNSAMQAFEMPEFTTISNQYNYDFDTDTICQGAEIAFSLDDFDLDVNFHWEISPATASYPTGMHPEQDTNIVTFVFSDEGTFDIIVYAYNDCDANAPDTIQVVVRALEHEVFTDVVLCEECILDGISLIAPDAGCIISSGTPLILTEDPNGDGAPGWQGLTEVTGPGLQTNVVTNAIGCQYTQSVEVVEIPLPPREVVDLYFCFDEFPVFEAGVMFANPGTARNITLENGAVSGCDSLINVTARAIDIFGQGSVSGCDAGMVTITFAPILIEPADYDSIHYVWYDETGTIVTDTDAVDSQLDVMEAGAYRVEVTVYKDGTACMQPFGNFEVDASSLTPVEPMIAFAPNEICVTESVAKIYVDNQGLGESYTWVLTPALPFMTGVTSDTIYVDITSAQDFEFCVIATNGCGQSGATCDDVVVSTQPSSEFTVATEMCIDSTVIVTYIGGDGTVSTSEFTWDFGGATVVSGGSLLGPGPFELRFDTPGTQEVSMYLTESGCESELTRMEIEVIDRFDAPVVECHPGVGYVAFTYDDTDVDGIELEVVTGQQVSIITSDSVVVTGLSTEEAVDISIIFNSEHTCGAQTVSASCAALPCPEVGITLAAASEIVCLEADGTSDPITLSVDITGDDTGTGSWLSSAVSGDVLDPLLLGEGDHILMYEYAAGGCTFAEELSLSVVSQPEVESDVRYEWCDDDLVATVRIVTDAASSIITWAGSAIESDEIQVETAGSYDLIVTSPDGCSVQSTVVIEPLDRAALEMFGEIDVVTGSQYQYQITPIMDIDDIRYEWSADGLIICGDCIGINFTVEGDTELCVSAIINEACSETICTQLRSIEKTILHMPNIFSPNGDNVNDTFSFQANNENTMIESIQIYDRYGEMVYLASDYMHGENGAPWDGTLNGAPCAPGVYVYVIRYIDIDGSTQQKAGDITLIR